MVPYCHRCRGELPAAHQQSGDDDDAGLFCGRCGAPQLKLPEHMRVRAGVAEGSTTGTLPPPVAANESGVDWRLALSSAGVVAVLGAALVVIGLKVNAVGLLSTLWVLSAGVISLGLYRKRATRQRLDGRVGFRLGIVTGLLLLASIGVAGAMVGVALRFGTQAMTNFDEQSAAQTKVTQAWMVNFLARQGQDKAAQERYVEMLNSPLMRSPEMRAGGELASLAFEGVLILLICGGGGAFAGMLQGRQAERLERG